MLHVCKRLHSLIGKSTVNTAKISRIIGSTYIPISASESTSARSTGFRLFSSISNQPNAPKVKGADEAKPSLPKLSLDTDLPTNDKSENLLKIRHSTAHVMAMAVQRLFPRVRVTIGPWIENGFYYDFFVPEQQLSPEDLKKVKKEMDRIIRANYPIRREEVSVEEARKRIDLAKEPFKLEILENILAREPTTPTITIYHIGDEWWDLCAGPHVETTGKIPQNAVEIQSIAGAYWRGDEKNPMLQRIYGTAWENADQLELFNYRQSEAKRRDHRVLGKALNLFSIQEEAGGGLVFWHPKGSIVRRQIEDFWKEEHVNRGYELLYTPHIANLNLWKTSGHVDFYRNDMFQTITIPEDNNAEYQLKPMNCPFHCLAFKDTPKSYRDLPIRWAELGTVYRYEKSGTLHGLFRVRGFTQDDAHIFCLPEQLEQEIISILSLIEDILGKFGFQSKSSFEIMLSTRPKDSVGSDEIWQKATDALIHSLKAKGWPYSVDEGGGAFYGPKIDIKIKDAIGRKWQCSTVQCDFNLPERFELEYTLPAPPGSTTTGAEATTVAVARKARPIMVHRAIFGSLERFFGILIENSAGELPFWIAPVQLRLLPVVEDALPYCEELQAKAKSEYGLRVEIDRTGNRISKQIRTAIAEKIPIAAIIGMNEVKAGKMTLRLQKLGDLGGSYQANDVLQKLRGLAKKGANELKVEMFEDIPSQ